MRRNAPTTTSVYPFAKGLQGMHMHADAQPVRALIEDDEYDECADAEDDPFVAREDKAPSPAQDESYMTSDTTRLRSPGTTEQTLSYANPSYKPPSQQHQPHQPAVFRTAAEVANGDECTQPLSSLDLDASVSDDANRAHLQEIFGGLDKMTHTLRKNVNDAVQQATGAVLNEFSQQVELVKREFVNVTNRGAEAVATLEAKVAFLEQRQSSMMATFDTWEEQQRQLRQSFMTPS